MRKILAAAAIAAASAATSACGRVDNGGGPTVSRNFPVGNFQQIEVAGPYDVDVRTGGNASVSAQGSQKVLDRTVVEVQGNKLVIHPQEGHGFFHFSFGSHGNAHFTVTVPQLSGATIAGSGGINVDRVQGASFDGSVAGSGGLTVNNVNVQSLTLSIGGSGSAKATGGKAASADYSIGGQLVTQVTAVVIAVVWSAVVALVALLIVKAVMGLRVTESAETDGLDLTSHGERAYN